MPRPAPPEESDLLCENCGYTLNGLPENGLCPECGTDVKFSGVDDGRTLSGFEERSGLSSFVATTLAILLRPRQFYRGIVTRADHPAAGWFARRHRVIAAGLFSAAAVGHLLWLDEQIFARQVFYGWRNLVIFVVLAGAVFAILNGVTRLAAWLSSIEGRFWGMRLPKAATARALKFHAASYLPVGLLAVTIVWGYRWLLWRGALDARSGPWYPWALSAAVVLSAGYLFQQYVIAMRGIRYANR